MYNGDVQKSIHYLLVRNNATLFRHGRSFIIEVVPNTCSSSNVSTISVRGEKYVFAVALVH